MGDDQSSALGNSRCCEKRKERGNHHDGYRLAFYAVLAQLENLICEVAVGSELRITVQRRETRIFDVVIGGLERRLKDFGQALTVDPSPCSNSTALPPDSSGVPLLC
jgi:hypothetical protein